jgi:hypothetical protein
MASRVVIVVSALLVFAAVVVAILVPRLRKPIAAIVCGVSLLAIRQRYFLVPGVRGMPFGRTASAILSPQQRAHLKPKAA